MLLVNTSRVLNELFTNYLKNAELINQSYSKICVTPVQWPSYLPFVQALKTMMAILF